MAKLARHAFDALFSFSYVPLRLSIWLGLCASGAAFAYSLLVLWARLFTDWPPLGWTSTMFATLFLGGIVLMVLGIIGEYVGRIYDEVKQRPYFIVSKRVGSYQDRSVGQPDGQRHALLVAGRAIDDRGA
jgi:dolichol-phosphate mannosyltransferase